ncbi:MAG: DUF2846 domain-containing protein [Ramlibacter sp.]|jgi:hypothetical protein|nr:DUF2846 domain-containing protein [Ramlibacter sp.]
MNFTRRVLPLLAIVLLAGCASGVKHADMKSSMPTIKPGEGRIYFLRSSSMMGAAIQPTIMLDGQAVGQSMPGGFFYVDRPAGNYKVSGATEVERSLSLTLAAKEVKYVRSSISFGVVAGRVNFDLMESAAAEAELAGLAYTGGPKK